jgi:hypothetical protein
MDGALGWSFRRLSGETPPDDEGLLHPRSSLAKADGDVNILATNGLRGLNMQCD